MAKSGVYYISSIVAYYIYPLIGFLTTIRAVLRSCEIKDLLPTVILVASFLRLTKRSFWL